MFRTSTFSPSRLCRFPHPRLQRRPTFPSRSLRQPNSVNDQSTPSAAPQRQSEKFKILLEAVWLAIVGVFLALAANQFSPRGLALTRNYFPEVKPLTAVS